ncbi:unnamed protein product [Ostreobium quekettii]|uniref:Uncharacterized protein n=1 Tax=Ostreobium quekettii TaxID=121088 RepID=A0A8S1J610_9CHLO|nr:unnamed protein product [Ostreobium quekettii]
MILGCTGEIAFEEGCCWLSAPKNRMAVACKRCPASSHMCEPPNLRNCVWLRCLDVQQPIVAHVMHIAQRKESGTAQQLCPDRPRVLSRRRCRCPSRQSWQLISRSGMLDISPFSHTSYDSMFLLLVLLVITRLSSCTGKLLHIHDSVERG